MASKNAPAAQNVEVRHLGGEVFSAQTHASDLAVLRGELFGEKEKKFLREMLTSETLCFSFKDTFQIHVRTLWQPSEAELGWQVPKRSGQFVVCLHGLSGPLASSWTWTKFARPLFRQGFSVIFIDLPGAGKSTISQKAHCDPSRWRHFDSKILVTILEELAVPSCSIIAYGESVTFLLRTLQRSPQWLEAAHYFHNPIIDKEDLFGIASASPPGGGGHGWKEALDSKHEDQLIRLLRVKGNKYWVTYDMETEDPRIIDSCRSLLRATGDRILAEGHILTVMQLTKEDLCEAQVGEQIPVKFLVPSRDFKDEVSQFLRTGSLPEYTPVHLRVKERTMMEAAVPAASGAVASLAGLPSLMTTLQTSGSAASIGAPDNRSARVVTAHHFHQLSGGFASWQRGHQARDANREFERDLSYGVRKQMQDAIEASYNTYQEEIDKTRQFAAPKGFASRRASVASRRSSRFRLPGF